MKNKEFTPREKEVLDLIVEGLSRKEMAAKLSISINTLDKHIYHIHLKTGTKSLSQLIVWKINRSKK